MCKILEESVDCLYFMDTRGPHDLPFSLFGVVWMVSEIIKKIVQGWWICVGCLRCKIF